MKTANDFRVVIEKIEKRLGGDAFRNWHCHFTRVEFTEKGEKRHHTLDEVEYGPDLHHLATLITELNLKPVIISESPILDVDAQKMRDMVLRELESKRRP